MRPVHGFRLNSTVLNFNLINVGECHPGGFTVDAKAEVKVQSRLFLIIAPCFLDADVKIVP